ncbi:hypothetical protein SAMN04487897_102560 [Paenibacillus sp. yr247]|uniref:hypothetical protein n=1 Tax=Paenibacillus sp. yr247 TaxID=1761880 RepID=UPI00088B7D31|nr:hypothetical protein [Paenibacillus sp. yr247]SDN33895.1 hypothetical protein SAMN04487897_102560 [Paenibacillus sp. yr247]
MGNTKCIYCGKEDNLTKSDIIPSGLTNKKILNGNVCSFHNQKINIDAESYVINELNFLRNILGINTRIGNPIVFDAVIEIDDKSFPAKISTKEQFYKKNIISAKFNGIKHILGPMEKLKKMKFKKGTITEIDNNQIFMNATILKTDLFKSEQMLRMVAKIAFEWYCKENNINDMITSFKQTIDYIVNGIKPNFNVVEIVTDLNLYIQLKESLFLGSHSFSITYQRDGEVYVLYSFFGLVIYKVIITKMHPVFLLKDTRTNFYSLSLDGNVQIINTPTLITPYIHSKDASLALKLINALLSENLQILLTTQLITIKSLEVHVINIEKTISKFDPNSSCDDIYFELVGIKEDREITVLFILEQLGKHSDFYNEQRNFNENLKKILNTDEFIKIDSNQLYKQLDESHQKGELIQLVKKGISVYRKAMN